MEEKDLVPDPRSGPQVDASVICSKDEAAAFKPTKAFMLTFSSLCVITLAAALDATSLSIALPIMTDDLGGTAIESFWSGTSFLVTSAVFQPTLAGLSHIFGRKQLLLFSAVFFAIGAVIAAVARNMTMM